MKDKKFLGLTAIFFLLFIVGMLSLTLDKPASTILRAKTATPSSSKSFVIIYPQMGEINSKIKVSVYILDVNSNAMPNRQVKLSTSPPTSITPAESQNTNDIGMAQFFVSSQTAGKVELTASDLASNTVILNPPSIEFTE